MDKTYTVAKVLFSKEVQGRFGPQYNIRFTTNQTGETNVSGFFRYELKPGQDIHGQIVQKPGVDKNSNPVIYHNFIMAKKPQGAVGSPEEWMGLRQDIIDIKTEVKMIRGLLTPKGPAVSSVDDFEDFEPDLINPSDLPDFGK